MQESWHFLVGIGLFGRDCVLCLVCSMLGFDWKLVLI